MLWPLPRSREEWRRVRERGERRFLLQRGVLGRGLPMGVLLAGALELYLGGRFPEALQSPAFWGRLVLAVGVFSASGSISAHAQWRLLARRFEERGSGERA